MLISRGHFLVIMLMVSAVIFGGCRRWPPWTGRQQPPVAVTVAEPTGLAEAIKDFDRAQALIAKLRYDHAAELLQTVVDPFDKSGDYKHAAEAIYWLGYCKHRQGLSASAELLYKRLIKKYPNTVAAKRARQWLNEVSVGKKKPPTTKPATKPSSQPSLPKIKYYIVH